MISVTDVHTQPVHQVIQHNISNMYSTGDWSLAKTGTLKLHQGNFYILQ